MSIKRVTITVKPDILKRLDRMIDKKDVRNRSHAVEQLILRGMTKTELDTVVIMAGGDGARLRPITYEIPKPLIPIRGRPVLEHQINMLKSYDVRRIIIATDRSEDKLREYIGNGGKFGVSIDYVVEQKPMGSLGALQLMKDSMRNTFAVLNVDTLVSMDIAEMYNFHKKEGKLATMLLANSDNPEAFGVARMRGSSIVEFLEKPKGATTNLINAGFYILEPGALKFIQKKKTMTADLFRQLAKDNQLSGFVHDGAIFDVGTHEGYEKAIKEWKPNF
jgi:NDP-sugar pyrophosphorylase family protein